MEELEKRASGSTLSADGLVQSSMIHGKKALSAPRLHPARDLGMRVPGWVGTVLGARPVGSIPLGLPMSHADLSHALAGRLWSGPSGSRALPEAASTRAHPLGGAQLLPPSRRQQPPPSCPCTQSSPQPWCCSCAGKVGRGAPGRGGGEACGWEVTGCSPGLGY